MTKQTDRLTKVEVKLDNLIQGVQELKDTMTNYIAEAQVGRIACNIKQSSTDTQTKIQWYFLAVIIVALLGFGIKSLAG